MKDTLFLDRDGVINVQIVGGYVRKPDEFVLINGVLTAMQWLRPKFRRIIVVTNQQCVGKRICKLADIEEIHRRMCVTFEENLTPLDAVYCCPHKADEHCGCRKPEIGMALQAKTDFPDIDFADSVMVGDSLSDMQFAVNAGIQPVHVGAKHPGEYEEILKITPLHYNNLLDFAKNYSTDLFFITI